MKKILLAAASVLAAGSAFAADLPNRYKGPVAPVYVPPAFTWTGFYAGINAGYAFNFGDRVRTTGVLAGNINNVAIGARPATVRLDNDGFAGGGQVGFNYQFGQGSGIVVGVEADIQYTDLDGRTNFSGFNPVVGGAPNVSTFRQSLDYLGTARGRIGYAFDRFMVYGTGGFAFGDVTQRADFFNPQGSLQFAGRRSETETGYAYGGGVEYALTGGLFGLFSSSAITLKAEYLHFDLGRQTVAVPTTGTAFNGGAVGAGAYNSRFDTSGDLVRAGLNFKFGTN